VKALRLDWARGGQDTEDYVGIGRRRRRAERVQLSADRVSLLGVEPVDAQQQPACQVP
jgi:hypothetical protein